MVSKRHPSIRPSHPGEIIAADMEAMKLGKVALAGALGISRRTLYDILDQKHGVSAQMAVRLEKVLGSSAEFWLNLQAAQDLWNARQTTETKGLKRLIGKRAA